MKHFALKVQSKLPSSLWKNHTCSPTFLLRCYSAYQTLLSAGDASEGLSRNSTRPLAANGISCSKSTCCHLQGWVRVRELQRVCQVTVGARESRDMGYKLLLIDQNWPVFSSGACASGRDTKTEQSRSSLVITVTPDTYICSYCAWSNLLLKFSATTLNIFYIVNWHC